MKKNYFIKIFAAAASILMVASLASCGEKAEPMVSDENKAVTTAAVEETEAPVIQTEEVQTEEEQIDPTTLAHNPLTGEYGYNADALGKRPVAVMINNIDLSLPQYGIGSADYIYEVVVEGGITRLMAVFADYSNVPTLCSIRSCRYYYPLIANGLDAIYCHWGMNMTIAKETLERLDIDRFDGDDSAYYDGLFYNDSERLEYYSREHTGCLDGSRLPEYIDNFGFRKESKKGSEDMMKFAEGAEMIDISDVSCGKVDVEFSESYFSTFTYDETDKKYYKCHSGDPHMDAATGEQLSFTNVFALQTGVRTMEDGYLMEVDLTGGTGYYLSGGKIQEINWSKASDYDNFVFTDKSGNPLTVNRGKCYIGITDSVTPYYD